jgi:hypothetical protein
MNVSTRARIFAVAFCALAYGCSSDSPTQVTQFGGRYEATSLQVTPSGQASIDVLRQGGTLTIVVATDNATSGSLALPPSVTGSGALVVDMVGRATQTESTVRFSQAADTFVRDLTWTVGSASLEVSNQLVNGVRYSIVLMRR